MATTTVADQDISDILNYIALDNRDAAGAFARELSDAFDRIARFPDAGTPLSGLGEPVRFIRVSSRFRRYLVFYRRLDPLTIQIVRIAHGARDVPALLQSR